jgi:hypothetical protein
LVSRSKTGDPGENISRQARWIGVKAKSLISMPDFAGRVIAVFPDIAYLAGRDQEMLWLVWEGTPRHWRGIRVFLPRHFLRAGQNFSLQRQTLKLEEAPEIDLGPTVEWQPQRLKPAQIAPPGEVRDLVRQWLAAISPAIRADGPGRVIREISAVVGSGEPVPSSRGSWEDEMLAPVMDLGQHCLKGGLSEIGTRGRDLVGLGPGLTPCGDDFLGGLLFAIHELQKFCPGDLYPEARSVSDLLQWADGRTHPISAVLLRDLACGQGPEPLHDLFRLLLTGEGCGGRAPAAFHRLVRIGHTTGWFILAGVLTGLLAVPAKVGSGRTGKL